MILDGEEKNKQPSSLKLWLKRIGFAGFLFFLIKGLVWIALAYFIVK
ncbi:MAG: alanyl-tRNA synthetase [Bacteroidia bacterium]